jgi:hypothetical protein
LNDLGSAPKVAAVTESESVTNVQMDIDAFRVIIRLNVIIPRIPGLFPECACDDDRTNNDGDTDWQRRDALEYCVDQADSDSK